MSMIDPVGGTFEPSVANDPSITAVNALDYSNFDNILSNLEQRANQGDEAAIEKLFNYYASERSEKTARDWTAAREDNQYQRLVADLQKAGISPYILSGATPGVSSASGVSHSGSSLTSAQTAKWNQQKADNDRAADFTKAILSFVGTAMIALAMFA